MRKANDIFDMSLYKLEEKNAEVDEVRRMER